MVQIINLQPRNWRMIEDDGVTFNNFWLATTATPTEAELRDLLDQANTPDAPVVLDETSPIIRGTQKDLTQLDAASIVGPGSLDWLAPVYIRDNFIFGNTESGEIGDLGWSITNGSVVTTQSSTNRMGVITRRSGAVANQVASMYPNAATGASSFLLEAFQECRWEIQPTTAGADFTVRVGICDLPAAAVPSNGLYLERLSTDTEYHVVTRNNNVQQRNPTGKTTIASWTRFRVRRVGASFFGFQVDDVLNIVKTTGLPASTVGMVPFLQVIPTTTTIRDIQINTFGLGLSAPTA